MYAKVIPFAKLPRKFQTFDYSIPKELEERIKIGHVVPIYFHTKKIYGVVEEISISAEVPPEKIKPIGGLTGIILPEYYRKFINWAADYYLASPALLYNFFVPREVEQRKIFVPPEKNLTLNKAEAEHVVAALKNFSGSQKSFFLYDNNAKETIATFIKLAQKEFGRGGQILILVPAAEDINFLAPYFRQVFGDDLLLWHGKMAAGEKYSVWKKLQDGSPKVVLGTRPSVFLPMEKLSLACVYNAGSADHKQWDMNPRYDARLAMEKLQELLRTQIVFSDIVPDLKIWQGINAGIIFPLNSALPAPGYSLVDLRQEKSEMPIWSFPLYRMIAASAEEKKQCVLFLNRGETDSLLICRDCRHIFLCPSCGRPYSVDNGAFFCYHCRVENQIPSACPKCGGTRLKPLAPGAAGVKKIISEEFPNLTVLTAGKGKVQDNFDVLITTDYFWKNILPHLENSNLYGAAMLDFDFHLARPEWNQVETAAFALWRFFRFAENHKAKAIVQTSCPENPVFGNFEEFYKKESVDREALQYPPFSRLIKIICKNPDPKELEQGAIKLYNELIMAGFHAILPFNPYTKKRAKNYLKHIILKETNEKPLGQLKEIVPDDYQIDIDPISIY